MSASLIVEVDRDGFVLVLQQVDPALVLMSMRMANRTLNNLAEILINPTTGAVIRHESCGHGRDLPPFRVDAWVESVKPLLTRSASDRTGSAALHFEHPTTNDPEPPSN